MRGIGGVVCAACIADACYVGLTATAYPAHFYWNCCCCALYLHLDAIFSCSAILRNRNRNRRDSTLTKKKKKSWSNVHQSVTHGNETDATINQNEMPEERRKREKKYVGSEEKTGLSSTVAWSSVCYVTHYSRTATRATWKTEKWGELWWWWRGRVRHGGGAFCEAITTASLLNLIFNFTIFFSRPLRCRFFSYRIFFCAPS